jgi:hypothetical protein
LCPILVILAASVSSVFVLLISARAPVSPGVTFISVEYTMTRPTTAVLAVLLVASPGAAWHESGHMALTLIAYRQLDDGQKKKVQDILAEHPHFKEYLSADRPDDADQGEWAVMRASVWADWVRQKHTEFNKPTHHYVNLPVKRTDGATDDQLKAIATTEAGLKEPDKGGALLVEFPKRVKEVGSADKPADRAVALCWVLHMAGDIHQPLHAATLLTKDSTKGDRGGNQSFVLWKGKAVNLHAIWDGGLGWDDDKGTATQYGFADQMARDLAKRHPTTADERKVTGVEDWAKESQALCDKHVYSIDGKAVDVTFDFDSRPTLGASGVKKLPDGYEKNGRAVAEKRVATAGVRLGDVMAAAVK